MEKAILLLAVCIFMIGSQGVSMSSIKETDAVVPGAVETTPSRSQYFTWINNTNEGSTEKQTLTNLDFFKWLHDEYGMVLDIYSYDAGNIDTVAGHYGSMESDKFKAQYPEGFDRIVKKAADMGTRLGIWMGPDGFGTTPQAAAAREETLVRLCRDYKFTMFKFDLACGGLRPENEDAFVRTMQRCREYCPDLVALNHRLNLGKGQPYLTTFLWRGEETYIDVHMANNQTATHSRVGAMARGLTPNLTRLAEDHGVCLSSCLDYWDDDLILEAFGRCLVLAPEIYGNPWLLKDDEFPKLARIYNLHQHYRDLLVNGMALDNGQYGPDAISRGDGSTRFIVMKNLTWNPVKYRVKLDESIGLKEQGNVELRQFHPTEKIIGRFKHGAEVDVEVLPFRACLLMASTKPIMEPGINGCDYKVVTDVPGKPVVVDLLGMPGCTAQVSLMKNGREFTNARLDGRNAAGLVKGHTIQVKFPGKRLMNAYHRKIADMKPCSIPNDAEALYEASYYAADNDALEIRSLRRSGPTRIPQVKAARDAFFAQKLFCERGVWSKYLFDGDATTCFKLNKNLDEGVLRVDFGEQIAIDRVTIETDTSDQNLKPVVTGDVSSDLMTWTPVTFTVSKGEITGIISTDRPVKYMRVNDLPHSISEIYGYAGGIQLVRNKWRASNAFRGYSKASVRLAWSTSFVLDESAKGSYFAIPIAGNHGVEGAIAAIRVDGKLVGAPSRSVSYQSDVWEHWVRKTGSNYTYFIPVTADMVGKKIDAVVLAFDVADSDFAAQSKLKPEIWITAYPTPFQARKLVLR